jgi:hypothetical protein
MSSLVVTGGATYEGVSAENVDSLIVETDDDPELNPEITSLIRRSSAYGYRSEDRNDLLRYAKIESMKKPLTFIDDNRFDIPNSTHRKNTSNYTVSSVLPVDLEMEKNKAQMKEDQINYNDLVVTTNFKDTEGGAPLTHSDALDAYIGDFDGEFDGGFDGGDLLFKLDGGNEEINDGFEGGAVGEYFSW